MDVYAKLPQRDGALIFAGGSLTDFCEWSELFERPLLNRGIQSDTIEGLRWRIGEVLRHHPRQLFIMIGINDLMGGKACDDVIAEYRSLIEEVRASSPRTRVFLQSILPVNSVLWARAEPNVPTPPHLAEDIVRVNQALADMADGKWIVYVDLYSSMVDEANQLNRRYTSDGIHLNGDGYAKWREVISPYLASGE